MPTSRRVILISRAREYVGPALARRLAQDGHDLLLHDAADGFVAELRGHGVRVENVGQDLIPPTGPASLESAGGYQMLVDVALERFGRLDAAALYPPAYSGMVHAVGPLLEARVEEFAALQGYLTSTFHALRVLVPALREQGRGQIVVFTSDAGARPKPDWSLYGSVRAGQTFLVQCAALEHARDAICINAVGSKNVIGPGFPGAPPASIADDEVREGEWSRPLSAEVPLGRVGTMSELAAFSSVLLDGRSRFQTGQYFSYSGGWNVS